MLRANLQAARRMVQLVPNRNDRALGEFIEFEGAYILDVFGMSASKEALDFSQDLTAFEAFVNSAHLSDHYVGKIDLIRAIGIGLLHLERWRFPGQLNCILVASETDYIMKLHLVRRGEEIYASDIDGLSNEIVILSTAP